MNFATCLKYPTLQGIIASLVLVLLLSQWVFNGGKTDLLQQSQQRLAIMQTNAITDVIKVSAQEEFQTRLIAWTSYDNDILSARLISGTQLLASTDEADAAPRRLVADEKPLYDLANQIRTAIETNIDEGIVRKKNIIIDNKQPGQTSVTVPYVSNDQFAGILIVKYKTADIDASNVGQDIFILLFVVMATALVICFFLILRGSKTAHISKVFATIVMLIIALSSQHKNMDALKQLHKDTNQHITIIYNELGQRYNQITGTTTLAVTHNWDTDSYGRSLGLMTASEQDIDAALREHFASNTPFLTSKLWAIDIVGVGLLLFFLFNYHTRLMATVRQHFHAYAYVAPAVFAMLVLVFFPFTYGIALSFTDTTLFNEYLPFHERWIGWDNYLAILGDFNLLTRGEDGLTWNYQNFYWTLMVTVAWTVSNVVIGVTIGFILAMALNTEKLRGKAIYRVILILPWAIPNYITALVWRGMFHPQFGVINQFVQMFGFEPVSWFDGVGTSFLTGVATNGWLSFPFMMVVILGALQSIPKDMYEAAEVEGASRWQRMRHITLPLLKPTMIPAIVLSVVWTFNMFNIIFLVSGGEPAGANEILITKAYKIAFENYQYAYAAAYSMVIFFILLVYGVFQTRVTRATETF
jgi:arabinogalactan oligomer/maltooligosaccharide transport system permease protein